MQNWVVKARRLSAFGLAVVAAMLVVLLCIARPAVAQTSASDLLKSLPPGTLQNLSPDMLQRLRQKGLGGNGQDEALPPVVQTFSPATPPVAQLPPSRLETIYSMRAGAPLSQFGYSLLGAPATVSILQSGALQDNYILGIGDELQFDLRGQENSSYTQMVDTSGRIVLPKIAPIEAAGRTLGEFRRDLENRIAQSYVSTKVFVSITTARQANVLVSGAVNTPGTRIVSGLSTLLDAILLSGGIAKNGSLRDVKLIRGDTVQTIDLYSVIAQGAAARLDFLRDGDRIFVPQLGSTVAISGNVRRPAIYELPAGEKAISVSALLHLAGGVEIRGTYRVLLLQTRADGKQEYIDVSAKQNAVVRDGELLIVQPNVSEILGGVTLSGDVKVPGQYSLSRVKTLHDLLTSSDVFGLQPYLLLGVILRDDRTSYHRVIVPFSPLHVLQGKENLDLQSRDEVHIMTVDEMRDLAYKVLPPDETANDNSNCDSQAVRQRVGSSYGIALAAGMLPCPMPSTAAQNGQQGAPGVPQNPYSPSVGSQQGYPNYPSGQQGFPGYSGGQQGYPGYSGQQGYPGYPGGQQGYPGYSGGQQGYPGYPGNAGGPQGYPGYPGVQQGYPSYNPGPGGAVAPGSTDYFGGGSVLGGRGGSSYSPSGTPGQTDFSLNLMTPTVEMSGASGTFSLTDAELIGHVLAEYAVRLQGAVRNPGIFLVMPGTTLDELIVAADGLDRDVDLSSIEITSKIVDNQSGRSETVRHVVAGTPDSLKQTVLGKYDVIVFRHVYSDLEGGVVTLVGEFRYPGDYHILRGEHLSSVIARAGGLTEVAYPFGAVFTRPSVAAIEQQGYNRAARELQQQLAVLAAQPQQGQVIQSGNLEFLAGVVLELKNTPAIGRVTVVADPVVLESKPDLDPVLETGDAIFMPKRPTSVTVSGEVLSPGSFLFRSSLGYKEYIRMAGGETSYANMDSTFVILPDGSAEPIQDNWLTFGSGGHIPPGSTIVVPRDLTPFQWNAFLKDATQILSSLAVSAASISILHNN